MILGNRPCWPVLTLAAAFFAGCAAPSPISRIDANRALYESWPIEMRQAVLDGKVVEGMTPDMVRMALGKPTEVQTRSGRNGYEEVWIYRTQTSEGAGSIMRNTNIAIGGSVGGDMGGVGIMADPTPVITNPMGVPPSEDTRTEILFRNGVVVRGTK